MNIQILELPILILSIVANISIGLIAFSRNTDSWTNKLFGLLSLAWIGWTATTYLSLHNDQLQLELVRASMFFVVMMNTVFFFLVQVFPKVKYTLSKRQKILLWYAVGVGIVALSPWLFVSVEVSETGAVAPQPGPGMLLFLIHTVVFMVGGLTILTRRLRASAGLLRSQLSFILAGTALFFTIIPLTNFILPIVFERSEYVIFSPVATVVFAGFISYTIIRHRLFDIRLVVARTVAYVLMLFFLASLYALLAFGITDYFFQSAEIQPATQMVYVVLAVVLAFTFQPIKNVFDSLTNKVFYRDSYVTQEVISAVGEVLTTEIDIELLSTKSLELLSGSLKSSVAGITLFDESDQIIQYNLNAISHFSISKSEFELFQGKLTIRDEVEDEKLRRVMDREDVSLILRLTSSDATVGFLLLGPKQSGNAYSVKDLNLLEILSNDMAIGLQNALQIDEIKNFNITLQERIKDATNELKAKNHKLRELDKAKDDFISMASHQLRTPLTTVKGYLSMLNDGDFGKVSKKQQQILELAYNSSERMVYLIADLLNVSRINTGKFVIDKTEVDLLDVVKSEVKQLEGSAKAHDVKLKTKLPKSAPTVMLDESKIRQVMMNFVDNAIYYTPDGGRITVELKVAKDSLEYTVTDTGIGVPTDEQEHMFTKFYRAKNARKARPDGTGLGLYLAKKVVSAQGGSIIFKSKENEGSTFGFRFSLAAIGAKKSKR